LSGPAAGAGALVLAQAARALAGVAIEGRSADAALIAACPDAVPVAAIRAVTLGSVRWYQRLDPVVARLLEGRELAPMLRMLLVAALHQLEYSRNPPPATISCAVDAARLLGQPRAAGMVNALLRRFRRERASLLEQALQSVAAAGAHPAWLIEALQAAWPREWQRIVEANNGHPPMTLRVDLSRTSAVDYAALLTRQGLAAQSLSWLPSALVLDRPVSVAQLPGFAEGLVSVQDAGAQLASVLLGVTPGMRVLDACAAPGGKTGALLEAAAGSIELTAIDLDPARLELIRQNLRRLRRQARLVQADLRGAPDWWDGRRFDRILVDAPCSATGVIRRHPDIKLLRRPQDLPALQATQRAILGTCLALLEPGGRLLYSTCSVLPAENEGSVERALQGLPGARALAPDGYPGPASLWHQRPIGMQLLPGDEAPVDGFYYACLTVT
jgi:16S rRNA (cytosine967-C5)-methyltransferase